MIVLKEYWEWLSGKRTYIVGGLMILLGLLQSDEKLILEGLGLITVRAGFRKVENQLKPNKGA